MNVSCKDVEDVFRTPSNIMLRHPLMSVEDKAYSHHVEDKEYPDVENIQ